MKIKIKSKIMVLLQERPKAWCRRVRLGEREANSEAERSRTETFFLESSSSGSHKRFGGYGDCRIFS